MLKTVFYLTEPNATKPTPLFAFASFTGQRVKVYTKLSVHPEEWAQSEQLLLTQGRRAKAKGRPAQRGQTNAQLNTALAGIRERLELCYAQHRAAGLLPTPEALRAAAAPAAAPEAETPTVGPALYEAFGNYIEDARKHGRERSATAYATARKRLFEFGEWARLPVSFEGLTLPFFDKYRGWLLTEKQSTDNTVSKQIDGLKRFLTWAHERGYHENLAYLKAKHARREPAVIALSKAELQLIERLNLSTTPHLNNARALFLIMAYTGLRYSDLAAIRPEHDKGNHLEIIAQKTAAPATPLILPETRPLLNQLFEGTIRVISNQKLNAYIKDVARLAGVDTPTEKLTFRGSIRTAQTLPKWQLIGCHTGRRTYVTLMVIDGYGAEDIMPTTGHKDYKSFKRYVDYSRENVLSKFAARFEATPNATPERNAMEIPVLRIAV